MHKTDRRVRFTKMMLRESLMKLLTEKPIANISVTELCRVADVNRGTFYAHYRQPSDVLDEIENSLFNSLNDILSRDNNLETLHRDVLHCLYDNRSVCRILLGSNSNIKFMQRITEMSIDKFSQMWHHTLDMPQHNMNHLHRFMFFGTTSIIREWLLNDENTGPDEIAAVIIEIQRRIFHMFKLDPMR